VLSITPLKHTGGVTRWSLATPKF